MKMYNECLSALPLREPKVKSNAREYTCLTTVKEYHECKGSAPSTASVPSTIASTKSSKSAPAPATSVVFTRTAVAVSGNR